MKKKAQRKTTHAPAPSKTPMRHSPTPRPAGEKAMSPVIGAAQPLSAVAPASAPAVPVIAQPSPRVIELIAQLRDASAERAVDAAEQLGIIGEPAAVDPLIAAVQNAQGYFHLVVRAAAAMALGRLKDARAIEPLTAAAHDTVAEVSCEAILALGQLDAQTAVDTLATIAANPTGYYLSVTRHAAIRALGRLRNIKAQPTLATLAISTTEDASITAAARESLAAL